MESPGKPAILLGWWLIFNMAFIGVYDVYAYIKGHQNDSVSYFFYWMGQNHTVIMYAMFALLGHLFIPLIVYGTVPPPPPPR